MASSGHAKPQATSGAERPVLLRGYAARYGLSDEEESWRRRAESFAREVLAPVARESDRAGRLPREIVGKLGQAGFLSAPISKAYGGLGASALACALIAEELGRVDGSVRGFLAVHAGLVTQTIADFGTDAQRREWLPRLMSGQSIGCFALTEPEAGSDAGSASSTAMESGGHVIIDGEKHWITNGNVADLALVFANAEPAAGRKGVECYLVPTDARGLQRTRLEGRELGHRASDHARLVMHG